MSAASSKPDPRARLRELPAVATVLERAQVREKVSALGLPAVTRAVRLAIDQARQALLAGSEVDLSIPLAAIESAMQETPSLRAAINATGVIVHTNLGRAPLAEEALQAMVDVGRGYATVEYDVPQGRRGNRHHHATGLLRDLCGAEDAAVVNNCAAALVLTLAALARDREVIVSRGELIEIGGGFRVPDVMAQSGAHLVEVGTTNRTWPRDYESAVTEATALLLKVHRSNFEIVGFTKEASLEEMASIAHARGLPLVVDAGSGCLREIQGAPSERPVTELLAAGADLVMFSGDKLLGGPQAGVIVGRSDLVEQLRQHPLMRALRPDKLTLAALVETLRLWRDKPGAVPVWAMATAEEAALRRRAEALLGRLVDAGLMGEVISTRAAFGGGTTPSAGRDSVALALSGSASGVEGWCARLRDAEPPIIARIDDGALVVDLLCVRDQDDDHLGASLLGAAPPSEGEAGDD